MVTREEVYSALGQVMDPEIHRPITELEMVKSVDIDQSGAVRVEVLLTIPGCPMKDRLNRDVTAALAPLPGVTAVEVTLGSMTEEQRQALVGKLRGPGAQQQRKITFWGDDSATRVLAVASGKGGVGKSPVTGDVSISLAQMLPGSEMLLVTTPQEAAERVAILAGRFGQENGLKIAGVIENMSYFVCPSCDERHEIFGAGGGEELARDLGTKLLGRVPLDVRLREGGDSGKPLVASDPDATASKELLAIAAELPPVARSLVGKRLTLLT